MKVLIWIGVMFIPSAITTVLRNEGIFLGGIPTFVLYFPFFYLAPFLCAKWDVKTFEKKANKLGMTPGAYASSIFPPSLLDLCEANKNDRAAFKSILRQSVNAETITKSDANVLHHMFGVGGWY